MQSSFWGRGGAAPAPGSLRAGQHGERATAEGNDLRRRKGRRTEGRGKHDGRKAPFWLSNFKQKEELTHACGGNQAVGPSSAPSRWCCDPSGGQITSPELFCTKSLTAKQGELLSSPRWLRAAGASCSTAVCTHRAPRCGFRAVCAA